MQPVSPPVTAFSSPTQFSSVTQWTQWTVTTLRERKLRFAALLFPVLGAGVLAVVFYLATRVDSDESAHDETRIAALTPSAAPSLNQAPTAANAGVQPPDAREAQAAREAEAPPKAEPAPPPTPRLSCFLTNDCQYVCDDECDVRCKSRNGCAIGVIHGGTVRCSGPGRCEFSCAGKCEVQCDGGADCLVYCLPGFECEVKGCPTEVETCSPFVLACGSPCPG